MPDGVGRPKAFGLNGCAGEDRKGISFLRCKMFLGIKVILCYTNAHRGDRVKEDWRERCCKETFLSKESRWPDVG